MQNITLDFAGISSVEELHTYLKETFHFPDYYGRNMDALWDCLLYGFETPTVITLKNLYRPDSKAKRTVQRMLLEAAIPTMLEVFSDLEREDENVTIRVEPCAPGERKEEK